MVGEISGVTRTEILKAIRNRYREASKKDRSRMLDEFVAIVGCYRKHAIRLLRQRDEPALTKSFQGAVRIRRGCEGGADSSVGGIGQDMQEETEGDTLQHRGVSAEAQTP